MKTSLTNPEKIEILKKVLELVKGNVYYNICPGINYYYPNYYNLEKCKAIQKDFNMEKYKPIDKIEGEPWFEYNQTGKNKRIIIIKELITEFEQLT